VFPLKKVGFTLASSWHANLVGVTELVERVCPKVAQKRTCYRASPVRRPRLGRLALVAAPTRATSRTGS